jgi:pilus assembly protein CpaF
MNTGHEGSMTTIHANTPRDALSRVENMVSMAEMNLPAKAIRQQVSAAIWVVVQVSRLQDGKRKITSIQEITGMEGDIITMQEIFTFTQTGIDEKGIIQGHFHATGIRPKFTERLKMFGVSMQDELFDPARRHE